MNVFHRYTRRSLAKNRVRTLVTVVGIVLSMALFTAVIEGAYSGLQFLIRAEIENNGAFHAVISDLDDAEVSVLEAAEEIDTLELWRSVGWAEVPADGDSPQFLFVADTQKQTALTSVRLLDGRMPEDETELILPANLYAVQEKTLAVGGTLTLTLGDDPDLPDDAHTREQTFTVVGIYRPLPAEIEPYDFLGSFALTCGGGSSGASIAIFTVKHPARAYDFLETVNGLGSGVKPHQYLLAFYGGVRGNGLKQMLYGFAAILVLLIAFGSVSLIYNSFSISVSERTKQIGILKSVGATRRQIRGTVLYEALLLSAISIPIGLVVGCVGIGLTLYFLRDGFKLLVDNGGPNSVQMQIILNVPALGIAAAVCLVTTLISAWIPAVRAVRVSPMQAIRQSEDVKLTPRDVRSAKLTQRLFGFAGTMAAKNFRRNRRRYRATVISLFLSVVLFIAASSFCAYLTDAVNSAISDGTAEFELLYYTAEDLSPAEADARLTLLQNEYVQAGVYTAQSGGSLNYPVQAVTQDCLESETVYVEQGTVLQETLLLFVRDAAFRRLCLDNGLDPDAYFDGEHPVALLKNQCTSRYYNEKGAHWAIYEVLKADALPLTVSLEDVRYVLDGGWQLMENDGETYVYYPEDYLSDYWSTHDDDGDLDPGRAKTLTRSEAVTETQFTVNAMLKTLPFYLSGESRPALVYPYSMLEKVAPPERGSSNYFLFQSDRHALAFAEMQTALDGAGLDKNQLYDYAEQKQSERMLVTVVNVFSYGFIILISLIAAANVFNTVSTGISLRRRELAMLSSIGLGRRDFYRMMNYECLIYGSKALLWGLPAAGLVTYAIYRVVGSAIDRGFYIPWYSVAIAVGSVFAVVFATMLYAARKLRKENLIDALKRETL